MTGRSKVLVPLTLAAAVTVAAVAATATPPESLVAGWPRQLGTASADEAHGVAVASNGDVVTAGFMGLEAFVARYDKIGKRLWKTTLGFPGEIKGWDVALSGSDAYLVGQIDGELTAGASSGGIDSFLAKVNKSGAIVWVKQFGTTGDDVPHSISISGSDIYVGGVTTGAFAGATNVQPGFKDVYLARFNKSGVQSWVKMLGTLGDDDLWGVAAKGSDIYIAGTVWDDLPGHFSAGGRDIMVAHFTKSGALAWADQFGTVNGDFGLNLTVAGNDVYVVGYTPGAFSGFTNPGGDDGVLARYNKSGTRLWIQQFGNNGHVYATDVAVTGSTIVLTGYTSGSFPDFANQGGTDGFVGFFTNSGASTGKRQFGSAGDDYPAAIALRSNNANGGAIIVAGATNGTVWRQASAGDMDAFVDAMVK